jgi:alanine racemase
MKQWKNNPTRAIIDCNALQHNIQLVRDKFKEAGIILPVKANAYGHGDVIVAKEAQKAGIEYLAIARINEGIHLREEGIDIPIINLGAEFGDNIQLAIEHDIELTTSSLENASELSRYASMTGRDIPVHLKIDSGMTRLGCMPHEVEKTVLYIDNDPHLQLKSIYSHLACSDEEGDTTEKQSRLFVSIIDRIEKIGIFPEFYHFYNSGAIIRPPLEKVRWYVRPGLMVYGYPPSDLRDSWDLQPVLSFRSRVILVKQVPAGTGISYGHTYTTSRETRIATIPVGYGDGLFRALSDKITVTINGKHYPQRGRITMDLLMAEVDERVSVGDEVIIFGCRNRTACKNDAVTIASLAGTIPYEILTSISERVERIRQDKRD